MTFDPEARKDIEEVIENISDYYPWHKGHAEAAIRALLAAYDAQAQEIVRLRTEVERLRDATTVE